MFSTLAVLVIVGIITRIKRRAYAREMARNPAPVQGVPSQRSCVRHLNCRGAGDRNLVRCTFNEVAIQHVLNQIKHYMSKKMLEEERVPDVYVLKK